MSILYDCLVQNMNKINNVLAAIFLSDAAAGQKWNQTVMKFCF